jgi:transposase
MPKKKSKTKTHYSAEFKLNAVKMSFEKDKTIEQVAQDLGISYPTLCNWRNSFKSKSDLKANEEALSARQENDKLKSENKKLKLEIEILKQATIRGRPAFASQK